MDRNLTPMTLFISAETRTNILYNILYFAFFNCSKITLLFLHVFSSVSFLKCMC